VPPLAGGKCLLPVEAVKGRILLVERLLAGARGPAREHRLAHPTVKLGGARGVLAPKAVRDFWGLEAARGLSSLLFSCRRGPSHCACGAAINRVHPKDLEQWVDLGGRVLPAAPPRGWVVPDGRFADASAAFPGMVWPTLRGLDVIDDIPSSENSSSSFEGITSGPFASAAAFTIAQRGRFVQRLAPSRFEETQGNFPPAVFGHFASAGPPPTAGLPSAIAPAVLPTPVFRVVPNFGAIVGAIFLLLNIGWFKDASGQKSDVLAGSFSSKNTKGNWGRYGLYGTLPEAFLVSGNSNA
jgi:hypothetical protein